MRRNLIAQSYGFLEKGKGTHSKIQNCKQKTLITRKKEARQEPFKASSYLSLRALDRRRRSSQAFEPLYIDPDEKTQRCIVFSSVLPFCIFLLSSLKVIADEDGRH